MTVSRGSLAGLICLMLAGCSGDGPPPPGRTSVRTEPADPFDGLDIELDEVDGPDGRVVHMVVQVGRNHAANLHVDDPAGGEEYWVHCESDDEGNCVVDVPARYFVLPPTPDSRPPLGPHTFDLTLFLDRGEPSARREISFDRPPTCWSEGQGTLCTGISFEPVLTSGRFGIQVEAGGALELHLGRHRERVGQSGEVLVNVDPDELPLAPIKAWLEGRRGVPASFVFAAEVRPDVGLPTRFELRMPVEAVMTVFRDAYSPGANGFASEGRLDGHGTLLWFEDRPTGAVPGGLIGDGTHLDDLTEVAVFSPGPLQSVRCRDRAASGGHRELTLRGGTLDVFSRGTGERLAHERIEVSPTRCPKASTDGPPTPADGLEQRLDALREAVVRAPRGAAGSPAIDCRAGGTLRDLAYGDVEIQRLDLTVSADESGERRPLLVYVHGGGWRRGDKREVFDMPAVAAQSGYAFASVNYRLSPEPTGSPSPDRLRHPAHVRDVAAAIAWLRGHADGLCLDRDRVVVMGHSAGAHLATLVSVDATHLEVAGDGAGALRCAVSLDSEGYDIPRELAATTDEDQRRVFINAFGDAKAGQLDASPLHHVDDGAELPRFLVVHRESVGAGLAHEFVQALLDAGAAAEGYLADHLTHAEIKTELGKDEALTARVREFLGDCASGG